MDPERTFNHFQELGMPRSISLDDFHRMYKLNDGNVGLLIEGIKERLLGRQAAELSRRRIQQLRDDFNRTQNKPRPKIRMPITGDKDIEVKNLLEDPKEAARIKQESAERILTATKLEWKAESERYDNLDIKARELQSQLRKKQEKLLLLSILEKREGIRLKRLGNFGSDDGERGIGSLLNSLRTETKSSLSDLKAAVSAMDTRDTSVLANGSVTPLPRSRKAVEMLTNLTAYHARIQKALTLPPPEIAALELQLRSFLQKYHGKIMPERSLDEAMYHLLRIAEARAERKYKFQLLHPISDIPTEHLDNLENQSSINQAKQQEIEASLRQIIRLKLQSENSIATISTFREEASKSLRDMLHEEQSRILGYIDTFKDHIIKGESDHVSETFALEARRSLGSSRVRIWEDVQSDLVRLQASQGLLQLDLNPHPVQDDLSRHIGETLKLVEKSGQKLESLLERKGRKADYGIQLADEIRDINGAYRKLK